MSKAGRGARRKTAGTEKKVGREREREGERNGETFDDGREVMRGARGRRDRGEFFISFISFFSLIYPELN